MGHSDNMKTSVITDSREMMKAIGLAIVCSLVFTQGYENVVAGPNDVVLEMNMADVPRVPLVEDSAQAPSQVLSPTTANVQTKNFWHWRGRAASRKLYLERKKATEKRCMSKWRCGVSGLSTPVAINARTGDVQCMSTNGKDCWWGKCRGRKVPRHGRLRPLVCGAHHKKMWGGTGYNNKRHWCNKVKKPVAKMCKQRKLIRRPLRRRL